jgi:hypothetical protein
MTNTRSYNTAITQQNNGGPVPAFVTGKNAIIGGGFDNWQRGTSVALTTTTYTADRWNGYRSAVGSTVSRQVTGDTTNLPFVQYCARIQRDSGNTSAVRLYFGTTIETINSIPYAGKTVTLSFYARAGANFSSASSALTLSFATGTNTNVNYVTGSSSGWTTTTQTYTLTTTWQRFTYTATIPSTAVQIAAMLDYTPVGTAGANDYYELTGVQLEEGSQNTPFTRSGGSIGGELALCQRYYWQVPSATLYARYGGFSPANSATGILLSLQNPVPMRISVQSINFASLSTYDNTNIGAAVSAVTINADSTTTISMLNVVTTGLTQYRPYQLMNNGNTAGYLGISAEL